MGVNRHEVILRCRVLSMRKLPTFTIPFSMFWTRSWVRLSRTIQSLSQTSAKGHGHAPEMKHSLEQTELEFDIYQITSSVRLILGPDNYF